MRELCRAWDAPAPVIAGVRQLTETVWADEDAAVDEAIPMVGPVWVGAGRRLEGDVEVVGPAVLWDAVDRGARAPEDEADEEAMEDVVMVRAARRAKVHLGHVSRSTWKAKRLLDVAGALVGLALTLPLYPLIMLAIWLEDGSPFFFGHVRETLGGREFKCWKFRSMRRDAEGMKAQLKNEVDGPQFFIKKDPRMTRVGRFLRTTNLDELPQFWNVLVGDMAIVGPRPSPRNENRFCAAWREARLSVRPGITGLWQVERTRAPGVDFQEWVRYDLEYVQRVGVGTDLYIIWRTIYKIIKGDVRGH
jgi:lipopolysaccharide/colanic/teichoic acid biosynthesis glycosyltransferase